MKSANIADFKKHLSAFLNLAEQGETIEICRHNVPIAQLVSIPKQRHNHTVLGCGVGSVVFHGDITEPLIAEGDWEMLDEEQSQG